MQVGLAVLPKLPLGELIELAKFAENAGFSSLWIPDERFFRDPWVCLSALATATSKVKIGTGVTDPFVRHPLLTATAIASVNELSGGRAILGYGAGISGFSQLGIERKAPATALKEALFASRDFWRGKSLSGKLGAYRMHNATMNFDASQVPIYFAGRGPKILEYGGELADGLLIGHFTSPEGIDWCRMHINRGKAKRDPVLGEPVQALWAYTSLHPTDRRKAIDAVKPAIGRTLKSTIEILSIFGMDTPDIRAALDGVEYGRGAEFDRKMCAAVPDELTKHLSISGDPNDCLETLRKIQDRGGIDHIVILPYPPADSGISQMVRHFAEYVLPKL